MDNKINDVKKIIKESKNIVFFGGAGVSTASGVPDFRSATGLYNRENNSSYSPEYMLSHEFFVNHPDKFMEYAKENLMIEGIKPNDCHYALTKLEKMGKLKGIITQNIDSLHQEAGSKNVIELHGNLRDYYCTSCGKNFDLSYVKKFNNLVTCDKCGSVVRPDIVLYGESLNNDNINYAVNLISQADVLIVGGTSLVVYPAAGLIDFYRGKKLVVINRDPTPKDNKADYLLKGDISKIMKELVEGV
ncbi:NAD-dependent protein deacylase [Anaerococcus hydrogenalis]|uniref:NAD-dependent protein deacetylase n=1 Tax=Anaerococcus hydrogenalis TaxID=33029 RepID=A0A2N6UH61_9FIRM|nr:NAD-dependent protein deacylase [Anaerococcus hydrogenalis]MDK7695736.1 NAD-dependent protein deacylase [Anaerococcus hydrogenalis]MDK7697441.1 NAD-dependent protein deacylase [Anaerococcus hydrogenalis]MDK7708708.1 NAD-dependent protein deacylase [Anaerococcus hydrogenalis]PMC80856.1 NAD-dependent protein deacylase [Anaerococcus hydrogenalis]